MAGLVSTNEFPYIPLAPEFIFPQREKTKQDCELVSGKRWVAKFGKTYAKYHTTILADGLYSNVPFISLLEENQLNYIITAKESNNITLYRFIQDYEQAGSLLKKVTVEKGITYFYRFFNGISMCDYSEKNNKKANWCEVTFKDKKNKLNKFSFITNHHITHQNVNDIIKAGRARWKIENQNNNVLKNNGYNIEHNFGHGKQYLSMNLLLLNIIAFLFHTVLLISKDSKLKKLKDIYGSRKNLFQFIRISLAWCNVYSFDGLLNKLLSAQRCSLEEP